MTIRLPDDLMAWLEQQAKQGKRTKNKQVEFILEQAKLLDDLSNPTSTHLSGPSIKAKWIK